MLNINDMSHSSGMGYEAAAPRGVDLQRILDILRQKWRVICLSGLIFMALGIAYSLLATSRYTASTQVLIDLRTNKMLDNQPGGSDRPLDVGVVESQVEIIKSDDVARRVVKQLHLASNPDFNGGRRSLVSIIVSSVQSLFSSSDGGASDANEQAAINTVSTNMTVKRVGTTYIIEIGYKAASPELAASVANGIADAYMVGELDSKYTAVKRASGWLQDRISELRQQANRADQAVQTFRSQNDLVSTNRGLMSEQQLADVNTQLITAKATAAEAKAKQDRIRDVLGNDKVVPDASVSDALRNDVITRLRAQYLDLSGRRQELAARYGENHIAVTNLRSQMDEVRRSISNEMRRIGETYKSDYEIAQARVQSLQTSLDGLLNQNTEGGQARVKLKDLESSAQTYRTLYDSFLQKFTESTQQQTFPIGEVRVISLATPPVTASWPKARLIVPGALLAGLLAGMAYVLGRDIVKRAIDTPSVVEQIAGTQCLGVLPAIPGRTGEGVPIDTMRYATVAPFTRFAETLRNVKVSVDLARLTQDMKVIGITSALPGEGKSTIAANLAYLTASSGHRTLLIDADLRTPSLSKRIAKGATGGLLDVLSKKQNFTEVVRVDEETGLHVLPCVSQFRISNASGFLTSPEMENLLSSARKAYDYVFIDFAPIGPVVDVKASSRMVDGYVFVVEWGKTSREGLSEALASAAPVTDRMIGVVLNRADPAALQRQESYKGKRYRDYYLNDSAAA